jgi:N-methylhydantoinase A
MASGPSAGVAGATFVSGAAGHDRIITFDMGGTSTDVCVVAGGAPLTAGQKDYDGYPVKGTMLDIDSVGAGGGSIAWVDPGGFVRVGPASAGADPGPACYGRGGALPTVSDANLVLGRLGGDAVLGGTTRLDTKAAQAAIEQHLAAPLGERVEDAALRVLTVVNANMASAIRLATVERGLDPRGFTLVAYGGAGPMHAAAVASALQIPRVLVPARPGVLCALGLLVADVRSEFSQTAVRRADATSAAEVEEIFGRLEAQASAWARSGGFRAEALRPLRTVDMRYRRQNHELSVPVGESTPIAELETRFHRAHRAMFGHDAAGEPTEFVTFRVAAMIAVPRPRLAVPARGGRLRARTRRPVRFHGRGTVDCPVYAREALPIGTRFPGPAIVEQIDSTTVVEPGQRVHVDQQGNLVLTIAVTGRRA